MDPKEKADWARHYDILFWTTTMIIWAAIGAFISYLFSNFNLYSAFIGINLTILTVYFGASFRELRFIFQDIEDEPVKLLIEKREFLQWWPFIFISLSLNLLFESLLFKNEADGKFYWAIISIINLIFIIFIGIRTNGHVLSQRIKKIKEKKIANNLRSNNWQSVTGIIILAETLLLVSYLMKWPIIFTLFPMVAALLCYVVIVLDKVENRVIENSHAYYSRIIFLFLYLIGSAFLIIIFRDKIFYCEKIACSQDIFQDIYRFVWCLSASFMGFSLVASQLRFETRLPYGPYLFYYPPILLCISLLIYSIFSIWGRTNNYIFYFITFPLCFVLAFLVDYFWKIILKLIDVIKDVYNH